LFRIECTTCKAKLLVRDPAAIGTILACPKCGSMVEVIAPQSDIEQEQPISPSEDLSDQDSRLERSSEVDNSETAGLSGPIPDGGSRSYDAGQFLPDPSVESNGQSQSQPDEETAHLADAVERELSDEMIYGPQPQLRSVWRERFLLMGAGAAGVVFALAILAWFFNGPSGETTVAVSELTVESEDSDDGLPQSALETELLPINLISEETAWYFQLDLPSATDKDTDKNTDRQAVAKLESFWGPIVGPFFKVISISIEQIDRIVMIDVGSVAANKISKSTLILIRLDDRESVDRFLAENGRQTSLTIDGGEAVRLIESIWPNPIVRVGRRTVLTGPESALQKLAEAGGDLPSSRPWNALGQWAAEAVANSTNAGKVVFLADWSNIAGSLPHSPDRLFDIWPGCARSWRTVLEPVRGVGVLAELGPRVNFQVDLVYSDILETDRAVAGFQKWLAQFKRLSADWKETPLVRTVQTAALSLRWKEQGGSIQLVAESDGPLSSQVLHLVDKGGSSKISSLIADWNRAAADTDRANIEKLGRAVSQHAGQKGHFPKAVLGGGFLPPATRLSWVVDCLPRLGYPEWRAKFKTGYSWNSRENGRFARRPIPELINPTIGPTNDKSGFPVTCYVGVAGLGSDAAELPASDPRAGLFGYRRQVSAKMVTGGLSNTIALLEVDGRLGAWAAGGDSTVRGLSQKPYINGPDHFGSGRGDGLFAAMADGSVRFFSESTDPAVLEQMVTIAGPEKSAAEEVLSRPVVGKKPKKPAETTMPEGLKPKPELKPVREHVKGPSREEIEARLDLPIKKLELQSVRLADFLTFFEQIASVQIECDQETLFKAGLTDDDKISVRSKGESTLGEILRKGLGTLKLDYRIRNDTIVVIRI
jgi:Protein of unknown function (DUF1559)